MFLDQAFGNTFFQFLPPEDTTPKTIQDWDFIMIFQSAAESYVIEAFNNLKNKQVIKYKHIPYTQKQQFLMLIRVQDSILEDEAAELKVLKWKRKKYCMKTPQQLDELLNDESVTRYQTYANYLNFIRAKHQPSNKQIKEQEEYSVFNKDKREQYFDQKLDRIVWTDQEVLRIKYNYLLTYSEEIQFTTDLVSSLIGGNSFQNKKKLDIKGLKHQPILKLLKHQNFVELLPIHKTSKFTNTQIYLQSLKPYAGPDGEAYFSFVLFLQKWLVFPIIAGVFTFFANSFMKYKTNSPFDFIYAISIMIWSIIFITKWEKQQQWQKIKQKSGYNDLWAQSQNIVSKEGYQTYKSRITNKVQYYLPLYQKLFRYTISLTILGAFLWMSLILIILSLNARGYIQPTDEFMYVESLSELAKKGSIFDSSTSWKFIPILIRSLITFVLGWFYRPMACRLTKFQKHSSNKAYTDSLILKYFVYQFILTFIDLFYIAFVRFDIAGVKSQFTSLFIIGIARRLLSETIIPSARQLYRNRKILESTRSASRQHQLELHAILEVNKPNYQAFDDYRTIINNFSYLTMLSFCFPLAPLLILVAHWVELFQDKYRFLHIFKRKLPQKYVGMGSWKSIIVFICYVSIVSNIMLFAFSSAPNHPPTNVFTNTTIEGIPTGMGSQALNATMAINSSPIVSLDNPQSSDLQFALFLFFIEHLFLLVFFGLRIVVSRRLSLADIFLQRREYKRRVKKNIITTQKLQKELHHNLVLKILEGQNNNNSPNSALLGLFGMAQPPKQQSNNQQMEQKKGAFVNFISMNAQQQEKNAFSNLVMINQPKQQDPNKQMQEKKGAFINFFTMNAQPQQQEKNAFSNLVMNNQPKQQQVNKQIEEKKGAFVNFITMNAQQQVKNAQKEQKQEQKNNEKDLEQKKGAFVNFLMQ